MSEFVRQPQISLDEQLEQHVRQQIRTGDLCPGERLPATAELAKRWGVALKTAQKALNRLAAAGLVERTPRKGTYVRATRPRVGLIFGASLMEDDAHHDRALRRELVDLANGREWSVRVYDDCSTGVAGGHGNDGPVAETFREDLRSFSLNAVVSVACAPTVVQAMLGADDVPVISNRYIAIDYLRNYRDAIAWAVENGRRQFALITTHGDAQGHESLYKHQLHVKAFRQALRKHKSEATDIESIYVPQSAWFEERAFTETQRLIHKWRSDDSWPDVLIVTDDVAMRGVAMALVQERVDVSEQLKVICFANEGIHHYYGIPVVRFEMSIREFAEHLLDLVALRLAGKSLPEQPISVHARMTEA